MSKEYLVEVTMTGEQWIEANSEAEAIKKAKKKMTPSIVFNIQEK